MIKEGRCGLPDRERGPPGRARRDDLMGAAIQLSGDQKPVPMHSRVRVEPVGHDSRHVVATAHPDRRSEIAAIIPERVTRPAWIK